MNSLFDNTEYEFRVTFTSINPRSLIMISNITYPKDKESIQKAKEFYNKCMEQLIFEGFYPYRSGSGMYSSLKPLEQNMELFKSLKDCLDPNNILAPGKYNL